MGWAKSGTGCLIVCERLSEGLGRCPKNPQGTRPLTRFAGSARTRPRRRQGKAHSTFPYRQDNPRTLCQGTFAAYPHRLRRFRYSTVPLTTVPLHDHVEACCCILRIVCCPRKIISCHLPGMFSPFLMRSSSTNGLNPLCL